MNNELIEQKSWWNQNWKWLIPVSGIILISFTIFFSSGMDRISTELVLAYTDNELYENALEKIKADKRVVELLGEIEPIDNLAILEGSVKYSDNNKIVNSSIRVIGKKLTAKMDITAEKINNKWIYKKLNVRIKKPIEKKQTIEIITAE